MILALFLFSCTEKGGPASEKTQEETFNQTSLKFDTSGLGLGVLEPLHTRKTLKRYDRSLLSYIQSEPNKPDSIHSTIYLLPFGNMTPGVEKIVKDEIEYLEAFFQLPVKILDRVTYEQIHDLDKIQTRMVPDDDFRRYADFKKGDIGPLREQIQAASFIEEYLVKNKPADAVAVLGITEHDIYNPRYNYLFGSSTLKEKVGVVSFFRLIDYGDRTKHNIRKVVSKQIANMFSIKNVKDYECLLNFHNSLPQLESGEFRMSPKALEKLKYSIGFDYNTRFTALEQFWKEEGSRFMSAYYQQCVRMLSGKAQTGNNVTADSSDVL